MTRSIKSRITDWAVVLTAGTAWLGFTGCVLFIIALPSITALLLVVGLLRYLGAW